MGTGPDYLLVADIILFLHILFVAFIVIGFAAILAGGAFAWSWVRNPYFRLSHLSAISIITVQSWFGVVCPLTTWEMELRAKAGGSTYQKPFISHWFETLLYYQAPGWVFVLCYTIFGALVVASWYFVRPRGFRG